MTAKCHLLTTRMKTYLCHSWHDFIMGMYMFKAAELLESSDYMYSLSDIVSMHPMVFSISMSIHLSRHLGHHASIQRSISVPYRLVGIRIEDYGPLEILFFGSAWQWVLAWYKV